MDLRNNSLTAKAEAHCLAQILEVAMFNHQSSDLDRGQFFFTDPSNFYFIKKKKKNKLSFFRCGSKFVKTTGTNFFFIIH